MTKIAAVTLGFTLAGLLATVATPAVAGCPAGSREIGRKKYPDRIDYECMPMGETLPVVDPHLLVPAWQGRELRKRIAETELRLKRYRDQLVLLDRWGKNQVLYANDIEQVRQELVLNNARNAIDVIDAGLSALAAAGEIPAPLAQNMKAQLSVAKAGLSSVSAGTAGKNSDEQLEHAADAIVELKNLIRTSPNILPPEHLEAMKNGYDAIYRLTKVSQRVVNGEHLKDPAAAYLKDVDDVIAAGGALFPPIKSAQGTAHILVGELALWQVRQDRRAVDDALRKNIEAKIYYQSRISEATQLLNFYKEQLKR